MSCGGPVICQKNCLTAFIIFNTAVWLLYVYLYVMHGVVFVQLVTMLRALSFMKDPAYLSQYLADVILPK